MTAGTPIALATIRVKRGAPRPSEAAFREAIERDRVTLGLAPMNGLLEITFAGPYTILVDGEEIDEWVVWGEMSTGVHVGQDLGGVEYTIRPQDIAHHEAGTGDDNHSRAGQPTHPQLAPALLYHSEVYRDLSWYLPNLFGNLHARQEWEIFHPMAVGDTVRTRSTVVERYRKRDRDYIVNEVLITDTSGRWLQRSRTHQSFLVATGEDGYAVDRSREKRADRVFAVGEGPGVDLEPLTKKITQEMCQAFSGPHRNYHNDREMAVALGFPDIVVQGMMSICFASELMTRAFGLGWLRGGKLDVRLVNVVWGGDTLLVRGRERETLPEGEMERAVCDVWCEKADGTKTLIGTASALRLD